MSRTALLIAICILAASFVDASPPQDADQAQVAGAETTTAAATETATKDAVNSETAASDVADPAQDAMSESKSTAGEADEEPAAESGIIKASEVPEVARTESAGNETELVCERVRRTGSHRAVRVCRTRGEIEQESLKGKDTFDELHRDQQRQTEF